MGLCPQAESFPIESIEQGLYYHPPQQRSIRPGRRCHSGIPWCQSSRETSSRRTVVSNAPQPSLVRAIGRWSLVALIVNSTVGSGIFGLPSIIAGLTGPASAVAYLVAAAGMAPVLICFAEVASRFREAGGPYLYARRAFGRFVGIEIAWLTLLARISAAAANANLFVIYFAEFWPGAKNFAARLAILALLLGLLAAANFFGVSAGTHLSNFFSVAKLLPLVVFIGAGLFFARFSNLSLHSMAGSREWLDAVLLLVYAYGGFEGALIPMSEARNPQRDAPFALLTALALTAVLYTLVQVVVSGVLPDAQQTDRPLAAAAQMFLGQGGAVLIAAGALLSVYGLLGSMMLYVPRLPYALAEQGDFPAFFGAVHVKYRTPHVSILIFAFLVWALAAAGSFRWNVTLSAVARLFTYGSTCAALVALRRKLPQRAAFRPPAGVVFAALGIGFSGILISRMGRAEVKIIFFTMAVALINWVWVRTRRLSRSAAGENP